MRVINYGITAFNCPFNFGIDIISFNGQKFVEIFLALQNVFIVEGKHTFCGLSLFLNHSASRKRGEVVGDKLEEFKVIIKQTLQDLP